MALNVYECMFMLDTNKVAGDVHAAAQLLHATLEKHHSEILASRPWDERRLAYPIKGHKKGLYYLIYFKTEATNMLNIEHDFMLSELILRSLTLLVDPKMVELQLAVARDEHALALQSVTAQDGDDGLDGDMMDDGPRRGRRMEMSGKD